MKNKYHQPAELKEIIATIPFKLDFYRYMIGYTRYMEAKMFKAGLDDNRVGHELEELVVWSVQVFNATHKPDDPLFHRNHATLQEIGQFLYCAHAFNEEYVFSQQKTF